MSKISRKINNSLTFLSIYSRIRRRISNALRIFRVSFCLTFAASHLGF
jgi:hypothetical protein